MLRNVSIESLVFSDEFVNNESSPFGISANPELASHLAAYGYVPSQHSHITVKRHKNGFYKFVDGNKRLSCMNELDGNAYIDGNPLAFARIDVMIVA